MGRRAKNRAAQPPWMHTLRVGDVLRSGRGTARVVRAVHRYPDGDLRSVTFSIKRCSWTTRPTTTYNYSDLKTYKYEPIKGIRHKFLTKLDRELQRNIELSDRSLAKGSKAKLRELNKDLKQRGKEPYVCLTLDCCDVHGVS